VIPDQLILIKRRLLAFDHGINMDKRAKRELFRPIAGEAGI
jgi:hypothetical protein